MPSIGQFPSFGCDLQQWVLPLVVKVDDNLIPVGTGFVLNSDGLFTTAAHVLQEATNQAVRRLGQDGYYSYYEFYAIYVSTEPNPDSTSTVGGLIPIDYLWAPKDIDIGFGWLRLPIRKEDQLKLPVRPVRLRPALPAVGDQVAALGYYAMKSEIASKADRITKHSFETAISCGSVIEIHPEFRDRGLLSFPCFRTDAVFHHGMSGGPIVDKTGNVIGVICSGTTDSPESYGSLIWPIFGAEIELQFDPTNGLIKTIFYDLAMEEMIPVDKSIEDVWVDIDVSGTRRVGLSHKISPVLNSS